MAGLPDLLTVEEAARVIRVGRTKAYAMTREWRATGGRSGLPVVDFGNVLRVPRRQLELLIGKPLGDDTGDSNTRSAPTVASKLGAVTPPSVPVAEITAETTTPRAATSSRTPRRRPSRPDDQPTLPFAS